MPTRILVVLAMLSCASCANVTEDAKRATQASGAIGEDLSLAGSAIQAKPPQIETAAAAIASAAKQLPAINRAIADIPRLQADNKRMHESWASDRQRAEFWWIVGFIALVAVLYVLTPLAAPIGAICTIMLHAVTLGLSWVAGRVSSWVRARKVANTVSASVPGVVIQGAK